MLFTPIRIGNLLLKNRIMMAPMATGFSAEDGRLRDEHLVHYAARATGQAGLIMLESTAVSRAGRSVPVNLVAIGRGLLRNPFWTVEAARSLNVELELPRAYRSAWRTR